jgi:hypothetical protein
MLTSAKALSLVSLNKGLPKNKGLQVSVLVSHLDGKTQRGMHTALASDTFAKSKTIIIAIGENNRLMMRDMLMKIILAFTFCEVRIEVII